MDGNVYREALKYFDYESPSLPFIVGYRTKTFVTIKPEVSEYFKSSTIKNFIFSCIEEDWGLIEDQKDLSLDSILIHNVYESYIVEGFKEEEEKQEEG